MKTAWTTLIGCAIVAISLGACSNSSTDCADDCLGPEVGGAAGASGPSASGDAGDAGAGGTA